MCKKTACMMLWTVCLAACSGPAVERQTQTLPAIFPDYAGCTVPPNIAPLNFALRTEHQEARALFSSGGEEWEVKARRGQFRIPARRWKNLLRRAAGQTLQVKVTARENGEWLAYLPFELHVAPEAIDPYIAYRLIDPGYELWNLMGIYQRHTETYAETPVIENKPSGKDCMNCHSFCMQDPRKMLFHLRGPRGATLLLEDGRMEKLNTRTGETSLPLVYPSWHPSGRFIAFSVNDTKQAFHSNHANRIEVFDKASDVVVYDLERHETFSAPALSSPEDFETFPTFSPDGKTLYFCSARAHNMPDEYREARYSLCAISFDPATHRFGEQTDTLYNAPVCGRSVSFPRVSPDGKYLLYTLSDYGQFSIWHKDADLYMLHLATGRHAPLEQANSDDVESYHSWSSNSRWIVFSSRRIDGLYTRLYIAYINSEGQAEKPFLLPQKDTAFYHRFMKSYNVPEFITGKVVSR
jgi:hypothetical protein